jgi:glycolate oxidase iron-sulfur subunit
LLDQCVHCGFCLPTCPTYDLWGTEADSPRGRIELMAHGLEPGSEVSAQMVQHLDSCLGCLACVTACPSDVRYDLLIEDTRAQLERNHRRGLRERALRRLVFETFTHPGRLRLLVPLLCLARALRLTRLAARLPTRSRLRSLALLAPVAKPRDAVSRLRSRWPAAGRPRGRVALLQGCVQRVFFAHVNVATASVLTAEGFDVDVPRLPRCCGALQLHSGDDAGGRALAKLTIEAFESSDYVVANAAGCGSALKHYGHLLREEPEWAERAARFSAKVRDATELIAEVEPRIERRPVSLEAVYHDACHLSHGQGVRAQPRALLRAIPGLRLLEPDDASTCCGSAGIYNLMHPETAGELGERKLTHLAATGARTVVAANPGCALQIAAHARLAGKVLEVVHPMEILARSLIGDTEIGR